MNASSDSATPQNYLSIKTLESWLTNSNRQKDGNLEATLVTSTANPDITHSVGQQNNMLTSFSSIGSIRTSAEQLPLQCFDDIRPRGDPLTSSTSAAKNRVTLHREEAVKDVANTSNIADGPEEGDTDGLHPSSQADSINCSKPFSTIRNSNQRSRKSDEDNSISSNLSQPQESGGYPGSLQRRIARISKKRTREEMKAPSKPVLNTNCVLPSNRRKQRKSPRSYRPLNRRVLPFIFFDELGQLSGDQPSAFNQNVKPMEKSPILLSKKPGSTHSMRPVTQEDRTESSNHLHSRHRNSRNVQSEAGFSSRLRTVSSHQLKCFIFVWSAVIIIVVFAVLIIIFVGI